MSATISSTPELIHQLDSILERLELPKLFRDQQPLEIELGSGDGSFLVNYAAAHPEHNFIGIERLLGRLRKIDKKGRQSGLTNLRAIRIESAYFLRYLLPARTASVLHIYFPDPWPKRKHRRHRLIGDQFPALAREALTPGGTVYLRTDDADYFDQMVRVFDSSGCFHKSETPDELAALQTDFEVDFSKHGISTLRAAYTSSP